MKTLKYILWAFLAAFAAVGCSDDPTYTAGSEEDPDNYGVYFPTQTSPTEVELDPAEEPEITYKVRRTRYLDAITVPVEITTSAEEIFEIEPIVFGPGEEETEFTVSFPNAKEGETYTCDIRIVDPHYISIYGPRATSLSFSVLRAGWELVTEGEATKGKWRDEVIGDIYSMDVSTFNPYPEVEVEIYQRTDLPGYYRVKVYNSTLVTALVGQQMNVQSRDVWTIIDARDPNRVFLPYQSTGTDAQLRRRQSSNSPPTWPRTSSWRSRPDSTARSRTASSPSRRRASCSNWRRKRDRSSTATGTECTAS